MVDVGDSSTQNFPAWVFLPYGNRGQLGAVSPPIIVPTIICGLQELEEAGQKNIPKYDLATADHYAKASLSKNVCGLPSHERPAVLTP